MRGETESGKWYEQGLTNSGVWTERRGIGDGRRVGVDYRDGTEGRLRM